MNHNDDIAIFGLKSAKISFKYAKSILHYGKNALIPLIFRTTLAIAATVSCIANECTPNFRPRWAPQLYCKVQVNLKCLRQGVNGGTAQRATHMLIHCGMRRSSYCCLLHFDCSHQQRQRRRRLLQLAVRQAIVARAVICGPHSLAFSF